MIAAAIFGVFLIPLLFIVAERMRQWTAIRGGHRLSLHGWLSLRGWPFAIYTALRRLWRRSSAG
jgi:hypothetical protein